MIELVHWTIGTGSNIQVRAEKKRLTIYGDVPASRRLVLGLDASGLPVCGIPISDKTVFNQFTWDKIVFARNVPRLRDLPFQEGPHLGFVGKDYNKDQAALWLPVQDDRVFAGILAAVTRFNARPGLIRLICYTMVDDKPTWLQEEDLGVPELSVIEGQPITSDTAWGSPPKRTDNDQTKPQGAGAHKAPTNSKPGSKKPVAKTGKSKPGASGSKKTKPGKGADFF